MLTLVVRGGNISECHCRRDANFSQLCVDFSITHNTHLFVSYFLESSCTFFSCFWLCPKILPLCLCRLCLWSMVCMDPLETFVTCPLGTPISRPSDNKFLKTSVCETVIPVCNSGGLQNCMRTHIQYYFHIQIKSCQMSDHFILDSEHQGMCWTRGPYNKLKTRKLRQKYHTITPVDVHIRQITD